MATKTWTTESMLAWVEGYKAIEKLMNKKSFLDLLRQGDKNWRDFWCSAEAEPVLGLNNGYYVGAEAVGAYYDAKYQQSLKRAELALKTNAELFAGKSAEDIIGVGSLDMEQLSCQVIEVAGDGKTAKGLWYLINTDIDLQASGAEAWEDWGRVGVDFINEDGQWKIWHMLFVVDIHAFMGTDWSKPAPERAVNPAYAELADEQLPAPTVEKTVNEMFHKYRTVPAFPAVPQPYETFADTFSYGM